MAIEKEFKVCSCPLDFWEIIIVDNDEHFDGKSTIYYHCDRCGEDFAIVDYYAHKPLYLSRKITGKVSQNLQG